MRCPRCLVPIALLGLGAVACAEVEELSARGEAEGRQLWQRLNAWLAEIDRPGEGSPGGAVEVGGEPRRDPAPPPVAGADPGLARQRFVAAYALLGCAEAATRDPRERELRRTRLLHALGYTDFDWLSDLQRFGRAEGEALRGLCRP